MFIIINGILTSFGQRSRIFWLCYIRSVLRKSKEKRKTIRISVTCSFVKYLRCLKSNKWPIW
jgi:hypothetical protein